MGLGRKDPLLDAALVGTTRQVDAQPTTGTPVDELIARAAREGTERALLLAAGARAVYLRAGRRPMPIQEPTLAPAEIVPPCSCRASELIRHLLLDRSSPLILEALERLQQAGQRLPHELLPFALGTQRRDVRSLLPPVLGERGYWLAEQNPEWEWATTVRTPRIDTLLDAEANWQEGRPEQRYAALRLVRSRDPALARRWVEDVWRREQVGSRAMMVKILADELSSEDEALLETALDDRSATVRLEAARLLARIPGSTFAARMQERADEMLPGFEDSPRSAGWRGLLRAVSRNVGLKVRPPEAFLKEWQRDGLNPKPPEGMGERAWWIVQVLAFIPPSHWERRLNARPADLIASARRHEWGAALLEGFARAAVLHSDTNWAIVLWESWYESQTGSARHDASVEPWGELLSVIPKRQAEQFVRRQLSEQSGDLEARLSHTMGALQIPWSVDLGNAYLDALRAHVSHLKPSMTDNYGWLPTMQRAVHALPPECFRHALEPWRVPEPRDYYMHQWARDLEKFTETIRIRKRIREEILV